MPSDDIERKVIILRTALLLLLFLSFIQPHKAEAHDTISRWTKDVLTVLSIDIIQKFTAHSTRAAVASKANVPLDVILSNIGWESAKTFHKFYHKTVSHKVQMTDAILS